MTHKSFSKEWWLYIYIYMLPPPPPGTQVWAWFRCALTAEAGRKNSSDLGDQSKEVCLIEERHLGRDPCLFSMALPHKIQFTYLPTQTMPSFKGSSTDNSHTFPHKPRMVFKDSSTENSHILSPNTCLFTCLLSMKQRQHM